MDSKYTDPKFRRFIDLVNPPVQGVQPVFLLEFFTVLQVLYAIFQLLVDLGCFKKALVVRQVRARIDMLDIAGTVRRLEEFRENLEKKKAR